MTADETTPLTTATPMPDAETPAAGEFRTAGPLAAVKLAGGDIQANFSAIGTVDATSLSATGSVIGVASIDGDATITASVTPALLTRGDTTVQQSYVSAVIVGGGGDTRVHQAFAPIIVGKTMDLTQAGGAVLVTGEADVKRSWVGIVIAPKATISEDSRVLISTKAALIIAAALFGGLGLVALAVTLGVRRVMSWRPSISLPSMPSLPDLSAIQERWRHLRRAA
ncbi:MAG TPA: hypothetical protein VIL41_08165 [Coriobacteriia bacterium]